MRKISKIFISLLFSGYIITVLFTNIDISLSINSDNDSVDVVNKNETINSLENKYRSYILPKSSKDFSETYMKKMLNTVAIIDTVHTDLVTKAGSTFLYVEAKSDNHGRIFAKLSCDESIIEKVKKKKFAGAVVAARISGITKSSIVGEVELENNLNVVNLGEDVMLTGECLEYIVLADS
jgi:hypothetical protein